MMQRLQNGKQNTINKPVKWIEGSSLKKGHY